MPDVVGALTFITVHETARCRALYVPPMGLDAARDSEVTANQAMTIAGTFAAILLADTVQYGRLPE
jgi:hypothetical protein